MVAKTDASIQVQLDIETIAGKIQTDKLLKSTQAQIKQAFNKFKKSKFELTPDISTSEFKKELDRLTKELNESLDSALSKLSQKGKVATKRSSIVEEEIKRIRQETKREGVLLADEVETALKRAAERLNLSTNIQGARSPLKGFLDLQGKTVKEATAELSKQVDLFEREVARINKSKADLQASSARSSAQLQKIEDTSGARSDKQKKKKEAADLAKEQELINKFEERNQQSRNAKADRAEKQSLEKINRERLDAFEKRERQQQESFKKELDNNSKILEANRAAETQQKEIAAAESKRIEANNRKQLAAARSVQAQAKKTSKAISDAFGAGRSKKAIDETTRSIAGIAQAMRKINQQRVGGQSFRELQSQVNSTLASVRTLSQGFQAGSQTTGRALQDTINRLNQLKELIRTTNNAKLRSPEFQGLRNQIASASATLQAEARSQNRLRNAQTNVRGASSVATVAEQRATFKSVAEGRVSSPPPRGGGGGGGGGGGLPPPPSNPPIGPGSAGPVNTMSKAVGGLSDSFDNLRVSFRNFIRFAVEYRLFYEILAGARALIAGVVNLQDALVSIAAIARTSVEELRVISAAVKDVATTTQFSVNEIADAARTLAQAGVDVSKIPETLAAVANFASATGGSLKTSADLISSVQNIFTELDPDRISDLLTSAVNISKLTPEGLNTILSRAGQIGKEFGLASEQLFSAFTVLRNVGIKDSTVSTGLRQSLLELLSPDAKTLRVLEQQYAKIGQDLSQNAIKELFSGFREGGNPLIDALNELEKLGFGGSGAADLSRLFDVRAENVITALIDNKDQLLQNEEALKATGTASLGAEKQLESLSKSADNLVATITVLASSFGAGLVESLVSVTQALTDVIKQINEGITSFKELKGSTGFLSAFTTGALTTGASLARGGGLLGSVSKGVAAGAAAQTADVALTNAAESTFNNSFFSGLTSGIVNAVSIGLSGLSLIGAAGGLLRRRRASGGATQPIATPASPVNTGRPTNLETRDIRASVQNAGRIAQEQADLSAGDVADTASSIASFITEYDEFVVKIKEIGVQISVFAGTIFRFLKANPVGVLLTIVGALVGSKLLEDVNEQINAAGERVQRLKTSVEDLKKKREANQKAREDIEILGKTINDTQDIINSFTTEGVEDQVAAQEALNILLRGRKDVRSSEFRQNFAELDSLNAENLVDTEVVAQVDEISKALNKLEGQRRKALADIITRLDAGPGDTEESQRLFNTLEDFVKSNTDFLTNNIDSVEELSEGYRRIRNVNEALLSGFRDQVAEAELIAAGGEADLADLEVKRARQRGGGELLSKITQAQTQEQLDVIKEAVTRNLQSLSFLPLEVSLDNAIESFLDPTGLAEQAAKRRADLESLLPAIDLKQQAVRENLVATERENVRTALADLSQFIDDAGKLPEGGLEDAITRARVLSLEFEEQASLSEQDTKKLKEVLANNTRIAQLRKEAADRIQEAQVELNNVDDKFIASTAKLADLQAKRAALIEAGNEDQVRSSGLDQQIFEEKNRQLLATQEASRTLLEVVAQQEAGVQLAGLTPDEITAKFDTTEGQALLDPVLNENLGTALKGYLDSVQAVTDAQNKLTKDTEDISEAIFKRQQATQAKALDTQAKVLERAISNASKAGDFTKAQQLIGQYEIVLQQRNANTLTSVLNDKNTTDELAELARVDAQLRAESNFEKTKALSLDKVLNKQLSEANRELRDKTSEASRIESDLETTTTRLKEAREKLAESLERQVESENFFKQALRESRGEGLDERDLRDTFNQARTAASPDAAINLSRTAVSQAQQLRQAGEIDQREEERAIKKAQQIEGQAIEQQIQQDQLLVEELAERQAAQTVALEEAKAAQEVLTTSVDNLKLSIDALNSSVISSATKAAAAGGEAPTGSLTNIVNNNTAQVGTRGAEVQSTEVQSTEPAAGTPTTFKDVVTVLQDNGGIGFRGPGTSGDLLSTAGALADPTLDDKQAQAVLNRRDGGIVEGPGTGTSDSIRANLSNGEFVEPADVVKRYGEDFFEKLRNSQIPVEAIRAVNVAPTNPGKFENSVLKAMEQKNNFTPVQFNIEGNKIDTRAESSAVIQFQQAMQLQALKQGRKIS